MIARLYVWMPYSLTVVIGEPYPVYEIARGDYRIRLLPPSRDPATIAELQPQGLTLNGKPAQQANVMRIDFVKDHFDRAAGGGPVDPPADVIRRAIEEFHSLLRFATRAAHAQPVSFPECQWKLEYMNDDGSPLEPVQGLARGKGTIEFGWSFIAVSKEMWEAMFALLPVELPAWDQLRLDAHAALPNVGTAVVLAATALEVFISVLLDDLAKKQGFSPTFWEWISTRSGRILQQPSVEEQFDELLTHFTGHSLKEDAVLWEAFKNLKSARNYFVHEGIATIGKASVTADEAQALLHKANEIIDKIRGWVPEDCQWRLPPQVVSHVSWSHLIAQASAPDVPPPEPFAGQST